MILMFSSLVESITAKLELTLFTIVTTTYMTFQQNNGYCFLVEVGTVMISDELQLFVLLHFHFWIHLNFFFTGFSKKYTTCQLVLNASGDREIFVAGDRGFGEYAQVFNLEDGTHRWGPNPSRPIYNAASVSRGPENGFAMIGGESLRFQGVGDIYEYHANQDEWSTMETTLNTPRTDLAAVDVTGLFECAKN